MRPAWRRRPRRASPAFGRQSPASGFGAPRSDPPATHSPSSVTPFCVSHPFALRCHESDPRNTSDVTRRHDDSPTDSPAMRVPGVFDLPQASQKAGFAFLIVTTKVESRRSTEMSDVVLVTGGTGTLGSQVVARLRDAGRTVRVLSRHSHEAREGI